MATERIGYLLLLHRLRRPLERVRDLSLEVLTFLFLVAPPLEVELAQALLLVVEDEEEAFLFLGEGLVVELEGKELEGEELEIEDAGEVSEEEPAKCSSEDNDEDEASLEEDVDSHLEPAHRSANMHTGV